MLDVDLGLRVSLNGAASGGIVGVCAGGSLQIEGEGGGADVLEADFEGEADVAAAAGDHVAEPDSEAGRGAAAEVDGSCAVYGVRGG